MLLTAVRGIDEAAVERILVLTRQAGGIVPGIVWLEPRWAAEGDEDLEALATIVGASASAPREVLWASAWDEITQELAADPATEPGTGGDLDVSSAGSAPSTLAQLEEAGFVTVDSLDDEPIGLEELLGSGSHVVVVTGAREEEIAPVVPVAVEASVDSGLVTVVADVYVIAPEEPGRGAAVAESLDEALREATIIVDDADLEAGQVAVVLGLDAAVNGEVGLHYGYGDGADAVLPAWTPP